MTEQARSFYEAVFWLVWMILFVMGLETRDWGVVCISLGIYFTTFRPTKQNGA